MVEQTYLKPMQIGEIFDVNFQILKRNFKSLIQLNLVVFLPWVILFVLASIVMFLIYLANPMMFTGFRAQHPDLSLIGFITFGLLAVFGLIFIAGVSMLYNTYGIFRIYDGAMHGEKITWKASLKGSLLGVLYMFIAVFLLWTASFILTFPLKILCQRVPVLIIPYLVIMYGIQVFLFVTFPLIAIEKTDPFRGIWRSCCLVWRNFGRTLAVFFLYILLSICSLIVVWILTVIPFMIWMATAGRGLLYHHFDPLILINPWLIIGALLILAFILFLFFVLFNFYYGLQVILLYDLRMRSEGYGILTSDHHTIGS